MSSKNCGILLSTRSCVDFKRANADSKDVGGEFNVPVRSNSPLPVVFPRSCWIMPPLVPLGWLTTMSPSRMPCSSDGIPPPIADPTGGIFIVRKSLEGRYRSVWSCSEMGISPSSLAKLDSRAQTILRERRLKNWADKFFLFSRFG